MYLPLVSGGDTLNLDHTAYISPSVGQIDNASMAAMSKALAVGPFISVSIHATADLWSAADRAETDYSRLPTEVG